MRSKPPIIFDLGGVVFQWKPLELFQQLFPDQIPNEAAARDWAMRVFEGFHPNSDWAQFDKGLITPNELAQRVAQRAGYAQPDIQHLIDSVPAHLVPMPSTLQLMQQLKEQGHTLFYLSNMPAPYAEHLIQQHDFFAWFEDGIFSAHVQQIKPQLDIFATAQQQFGLDRHEAQAVFIDDVQHNIEAAQQHGWHGIRFETAEQVEQALRQHLHAL
jgi:HAD superfamily hydrolase (TIGR01509 family)